MQYGSAPPQQPYRARPPIDPSGLRPKAGWYALCALPFALGLAGAAIFAVLAVRAFPDEPRQFTAPGALVLRLDQAEPQTIYLHRRKGGPALAGVPDCSVREARSERSVALRQAGNTTITLGSDSYESALDFDPPAGGSYRVSCRPARGTELQSLAVGERLGFGRLALRIVAAVGSFLLGGVLGAVVIAVVAVRRHRHKRRLELS